MHDLLAGRRGSGHLAELPPTAQVVDAWDLDTETYADLSDADLLDIGLADAVDAVYAGRLIGRVDDLTVRRVRRQVRRLVTTAGDSLAAGGAA
jgi:hypothetical protein